jgi:hypothetical protein
VSIIIASHLNTAMALVNYDNSTLDNITLTVQAVNLQAASVNTEKLSKYTLSEIGVPIGAFYGVS